MLASLLTILLGLVDLDKTFLDMKIVQIIAFYLHFLYFFFMKLNFYVIKYFFLKPLSFFSYTFIFVCLIIYSFYLHIISYLNFFFNKSLTISFGPLIKVCELYLIFILFTIIISVPAFITFCIVKKPMSLRNKIMVRKEFFYFIKVILLLCAP